MYERIDAGSLRGLMKPLKGRSGVFFARVTAFSADAYEDLWAFHEAARAKGVIIEGQISNPDERQLSYLTEMLGNDFRPEKDFLTAALAKWMPRMRAGDREAFADALCERFAELRLRGKTDSILKNVYMKMMCWLYYRFERLMPQLGEDEPPRVLYRTDGVTSHELILLRILSSMGADILMLEPKGDAAYLKCDPKGEFTELLSAGNAPFDPDFTLKQFRKDMAAKLPPPRPAQRPVTTVPRPGTPGNPGTTVPRPGTPAHPGTTVPRPGTPGNPGTTVPRPGQPAQRPVTTVARPGQPGNPGTTVPRPGMPVPSARDPETYFPAPSRRACTNAWMKEAVFTEILTPVVSRGDDPGMFYNAFIRVRGVTDRTTFMNELYVFYQKYRGTGRTPVIADGELSMPLPEETEKIRRHPYRTVSELIIDLAGNLPACANTDLQRLMQQAFVRVMKQAAAEEPNLNRLTNSAVYLLCWINRYQSELFRGYKGNEIPLFILMGGCRNKHDVLFLRYLSMLPADVLIIACDLNRVCELKDERLLELKGADSLPVPRFPRDAGSVQMRTVASGAEQELTSILYSDGNLFRDRQFARAEVITLRTTYDEIFMLWEEELKYRSNFGVVQDAVNMPVIYAKISGVEGGKVLPYWQRIRTLLTDNTKLYRSFPLYPAAANPFQSLAVKVLRNGHLRRDEIRAHRQYPFGLLREELQEHILDKIQLMLDRRMIKGTYSNGMEYTVIATILNLEKDLIRMLQSFDFTKRNPKIVAVCTSERQCAPEDAILLTFFNLIGFDVALFVPTGYQTIERYLSDGFPVEHQAGQYLYDLTVPDFATLPPEKGRSWFNNIFRRI